MRKIKHYTIIALLLGLVIGCKKYEEGPKLTLRTVKNRLLEKDWVFDYTLYNDTISEELNLLTSWHTMRFAKNGDWIANGEYAGTYFIGKGKEVIGITPLDSTASAFTKGFLQINVHQLTKDKLGIDFLDINNSKTYYYEK